ncbi:monosaccharide ABC transporter membrane protein (CUT2 family) [Amycolatopsis sulphurea]|uniref:Monosaccharide ABC transporter membrane protein (CUT2 family) n=1 Tax=Amycolatopsis sulphurea TaxID=76022 RepID=A0A2A9F8D4_9PSEU|nr:ABC transporter permease [Amycolatopsis sulphurea]PFG46760.1 monosaccharide ABC transporter membrane protein (CUT2 family) [Amycolatopsis sulphurea]
MTDVLTSPRTAVSVRRQVRWLRELALLPALVVVFVIGGLISDTFLSFDNVLSILSAAAALSLVVLGESLVLLTGKFDLSLESTMGIAPAIGAMLVVPAASSGFGTGWPAALGLLAIPAAGALIGFVNGFLIVKLKLNAFIVTLAMLTVLRGTQIGATGGKTLFDRLDAFTVLATTTFAGLPMSVWLAAALFALFGLGLRYHRTGRALYAIGGNPEAARAAGIRVDRISWLVFVVAGILAALGGLAYTGYVGALGADQGDGLILQVFAAAVIGGVSLDGGKGTLVGALTGVLLLQSVDSLLRIAQVPAEWLKAIYGGIILIALIISRYAGGKPQT